MVWLVRTKFYVGIFLSKSKAERYKGATILNFQEYDAAMKQMKELIEKEQYTEIEEIRPNRLYQFKDKKNYYVAYNRWSVGFANDEKWTKMLSGTEEDFYEYKIIGPFEYSRAVYWVSRLGAKTGRTKIMDRKLPVCGRMYWR